MTMIKQGLALTALFVMLSLAACTGTAAGSAGENGGNEGAKRISLSEYTGTVTIDAGGTYILSGSLLGQVVVEADNATVNLILDNAKIHSETSAAIYVKKAGNVIVTLAPESRNVLTDAAEYVYDDAEKKEPDSALFSKSDLTINGSGTLTVNGNFNNAIKSKDFLTVSGGNLNVMSVNDGITGKDGLTVEDGTIIADVADDGLHSDGDLIISGGSITIVRSNEGLEGKNIYINGGTIHVNAADDGINAADGTASFGKGSDTHVYINGGTVLVHADGDGIDSNGSIYMTGGEVTIYGPTDNANGALDYEAGMTLTGGTLIAAGSLGMACAPTDTQNQSYIMVNVNAGQGEEVLITSGGGAEIIRFTAEKRCSNIVVSSADIIEGETYYVSVADNEKTVCTAGQGTMNFGPGGKMREHMGGNKEDGFVPGGMFENRPDDIHDENWTGQKH